MDPEERLDGNTVISNATPIIELHIEELALHGLPAADRHAIGETVERELARLLSERVESSGWAAGEFTHLRGGTFAVMPAATPQLIGQQIAQTIYSGLIR